MARSFFNTLLLMCLCCFLLVSCKEPNKQEAVAQFAKDDLPRTDDTLRNARIIWDK